MKPSLFSAALLLLSAVATMAQAGKAKPNVAAQTGLTKPNIYDVCPSHYSSRTINPQLAEHYQRSEDAYKDGESARQAKDYASAESSFQESISLEPDGTAYMGLGESLVAQGKTTEALQAYWALFYPGPHASWGGSYMTRANLEYALLLNQAGQWSEAVAHFEAALPDLPTDDDAPKINLQFDPKTPQPTALAAATNMALGWTDSFTPNDKTEFEDAKAFQEYSAALALEPNWSLTNYYFGFGWHRLNPAAPATSDGVEKAKAALLKASQMSKSAVKKVVVKPLKVAMKPQ